MDILIAKYSSVCYNIGTTCKDAAFAVDKGRKSVTVEWNMKQAILSCLPGDHPWLDRIYCYETLESTNSLAKTLGAEEFPNGTVLITASQTGGRGRLGRSFHSPAGQGVYLSVILRPNCPFEKLMHLTCGAAVAACNAVEKASGLRPRIKWTNDLVVDGKKLGGILTELVTDPVTQNVTAAVIGIGINCTQATSDFPSELRDMATSLSLACGAAVTPALLAARLIQALEELDRSLWDRESLMARYRADCMTVGRSVVLLRADTRRYGTALDVDEDGCLVVRFEDGSIEHVGSGEISVRGMYGYI